LWSASVLLNTNDEGFSTLESNTRCFVVHAAINPSKNREKNQETTKPKALGGLITENLSRTPGKEGEHELEPAKFNPRAALASPATSEQISQQHDNRTNGATDCDDGLLLVSSSTLNICLQCAELSF
jgi:hypothetical protein